MYLKDFISFLERNNIEIRTQGWFEVFNACDKGIAKTNIEFCNHKKMGDSIRKFYVGLTTTELFMEYWNDNKDLLKDKNTIKNTITFPFDFNIIFSYYFQDLFSKNSSYYIPEMSTKEQLENLVSISMSCDTEYENVHNIKNQMVHDFKKSNDDGVLMEIAVSEKDSDSDSAIKNFLSTVGLWDFNKTCYETVQKDIVIKMVYDTEPVNLESSIEKVNTFLVYVPKQKFSDLTRCKIYGNNYFKFINSYLSKYYKDYSLLDFNKEFKSIASSTHVEGMFNTPEDYNINTYITYV